jgi:hypothetical protein
MVLAEAVATSCVSTAAKLWLIDAACCRRELDKVFTDELLLTGPAVDYRHAGRHAPTSAATPQWCILPLRGVRGASSQVRRDGPGPVAQLWAGAGDLRHR